MFFLVARLLGTAMKPNGSPMLLIRFARHACNPGLPIVAMLLIGEWGFVKVRLRSLVVIEGLDNAEQLSVEG